MTCSVCGSDDCFEFAEREYATGVVAPDGGVERRLWRGIQCCACGAVEEL